MSTSVHLTTCQYCYSTDLLPMLLAGSRRCSGCSCWWASPRSAVPGVRALLYAAPTQPRGHNSALRSPTQMPKLAYAKAFEQATWATSVCWWWWESALLSSWGIEDHRWTCATVQLVQVSILSSQELNGVVDEPDFGCPSCCLAATKMISVLPSAIVFSKYYFKPLFELKTVFVRRPFEIFAGRRWDGLEGGVEWSNGQYSSHFLME